ncbi:hypothetical protein GCM10027578_04610 [Spirosoma luteolum]
MTDLRAEITGYGLRLINDTAAGNAVVRSRRLLLIPRPNDLKLGQINLLFSDGQTTLVGDVQRLDTGMLAVRVYLPYAEFPVYYDVLRAEKPIQMQLIVDGAIPSGHAVPLRMAMLYADEPVGEGPRDSQL